jgi:hypothetical protein
MIRIGKVTVWGGHVLDAGRMCSRLVVENGKMVLGVWMTSAYRTRGDDYGVVYERDPRYRSPIVNRKLT